MLLKYTVHSTGHIFPGLRSAPEIFLVMLGKPCREEVIIKVSLFSENKLESVIKAGQQDSKERLFSVMLDWWYGRYSDCG